MTVFGNCPPLSELTDILGPFAPRCSTTVIANSYYPSKDLKSPINAFVISRLDNCDSLYFVQNAPAHLTSKKVWCLTPNNSQIFQPVALRAAKG